MGYVAWYATCCMAGGAKCAAGKDSSCASLIEIMSAQWAGWAVPARFS